MFKNKSISRQLSFQVGLTLFSMLTICGTFLTLKVDRSFSKITSDYLYSTASKYAENTKNILTFEYSLGSGLKEALEQIEVIPAENRRDYINKLLKSTLIANPNLVDAWTVWEPNALDGLDANFANSDCHDETGRFIPYWTRVDTKIECSALTDYTGSFWYENPLHSPTGILIEPNPYEIGGNTIWVCGVAFPIKNSAGKPVGVVGLDMSLSTLSEILKSAQLYKTGYLSLISNTGLVAVDKNVEMEGSILSAFENSPNSELFKTGAKDLVPFNYKEKDNSSVIYHLFEPLKISDAKEVWYLGINVPETEITLQTRTISTLIITGFIILLIVTIIITYLIIRTIINELNKGVAAMKDIAEGHGDLTVRMKVKNKNELGHMYMYFNQTMGKLQKAIQNVKNASQEMTVQGAELSDKMNDTAAAANEITANIESVNRQIQMQGENVMDANSAVIGINRNIKDLISNIQTQSSNVTESSAAIEQMVANIKSVTTILQKNAGAIKTLENSSETGRTRVNGTVEATQKIQEQSQSLFEASKVIQNIASQTNLLAMNAAIEAAHAGESGKGFSVVADEIRKLAEDSNTQGKAITTNLKEVMSSIQEVSNASVAAQQIFNEIYEMTLAVAQQEQTIMNAMIEQSNGGTQVLEAIRQINDITQLVNSGGKSMQKEAEIVSEKMDHLARLTEEINSSMDEMNQGMESINTAINQVNDLTHNNKQNLNKLGESVDAFTV